MLFFFARTYIYFAALVLRTGVKPLPMPSDLSHNKSGLCPRYFGKCTDFRGTRQEKEGKISYKIIKNFISVPLFRKSGHLISIKRLIRWCSLR